jgi:hypothetical protein
MEITAYGTTCLRFKAREGTVVADAFTSIVGPTGRGLSADIVTYSHEDSQPTLGLGKARKAARAANGRTVPTSLEPAFVLDAPGEYEVRHILVTGVRTFRDEVKGAERGANTSFVYELDGLHTAHLGDVGHLLNEEMLGELGAVDVVCVPIGGSLSAAHAAELVAQLDAKLVVAMPVVDGEGAAADAVRAELNRFMHEMSVQHPEPVAKLAVTISSLPPETTVALLEPRARA